MSAADLIAEARAYIAAGVAKTPRHGFAIIADLADALEAAEDRATEAEAEMHQRELHHFEVEQELAAALAVIEKAREPRGKSWQAGYPTYRVLSSIPADVLRERDRRVRAEAVREFRVNDLRDRAERADEQWKAWGDVNDCELRDQLRAQADRIEQGER